MKKLTTLPVPPHFDPSKADQVFRVNYEDLARDAMAWKRQHGIFAAANDSRSGGPRIAAMLIDMQNTFCIPGFELYVGGRSGRGAVEDSARLARWIYQNLANITSYIPTMDTHRIGQIFHAFALVDENGNHPKPFTLVFVADVQSGKWRVNPAWASMIGIALGELQAYLLHYVTELHKAKRGPLTVWPYHSMLGGIGHALVPLIEEAIQFHSFARASRISFEIKGGEDKTENYSIFRPEVLRDQHDHGVGDKNKALIETLIKFDALVIAGQARSHCVAWSIEDLLQELVATGNQALAKKIYLMEDCSTSVYVPPLPDGKGGMTPEYDGELTAKPSFDRFVAAGMNLVRSTDPMDTWPGLAS